MVRVMTCEDYDEVYALWMSIHGFGIRSMDDSREGIERFLKRNPTTSAVYEQDGKIVGAILCGHDGRRACLYHVCVSEEYRMHGIGKKMVNFCCEQLKKEKINKVCLNAFVFSSPGVSAGGRAHEPKQNCFRRCKCLPPGYPGNSPDASADSGLLYTGIHH